MLGTTFSLLLLATPGAADGLALSAVSGLVPSGALPMTVLSALSSDRLRALPTDGEGSSKQPHEVSPKLALRGKEKGCCGYPLGEPGTYKLTYYWLAYESEYANEPYEIEIYTRQGFPIGRFPRAYVFELRLEGSGVLRDGRLINYDGRCAYGIGTCYQTLDPQAHPFGKGGQQRAQQHHPQPVQPQPRKEGEEPTGPTRVHVGDCFRVLRHPPEDEQQRRARRQVKPTHQQTLVHAGPLQQAPRREWMCGGCTFVQRQPPQAHQRVRPTLRPWPARPKAPLPYPRTRPRPQGPRVPVQHLTPQAPWLC